MDNLIYVLFGVSFLVSTFIAIFIFAISFTILSLFYKNKSTKKMNSLKDIFIQKPNTTKSKEATEGEKEEYKYDLIKYCLSTILNFPIFVFSISELFIFFTEDIKTIFEYALFFALAINIYKIYFLSKLNKHENLHIATKYLNAINIAIYPLIFFVLYETDFLNGMKFDSLIFVGLLLYSPIFISIYILNLMSFIMVLKD